MWYDNVKEVAVMERVLLLLCGFAFIACTTVLPELQAVRPKEEVSVEAFGKTYRLSLTYADNFDNQESFEEDWDIGNPGYEKPEFGNYGYEMPEEVVFDDGLKGYKNDRYKQPYWSPKAVRLQDGFLALWTLYDPTVPVYDKDGTRIRTGYGLTGAVHSRRQFPYGYFETRIIMNKHARAHWDAWWAESNNPFSRAYGKKTLFLPTQKMLDEAGVSLNVSDMKRKTDLYTENNRAPSQWQGFNGQQVYEYDMYEWVDTTDFQWQAEHCWDWYGGYPGVEELKKGGTPPSKDLYGEVHDLKTIDELRQNDGYGAMGNLSRQPKMKDGEAFILSMLWTPDGFVIWFDGEKRLERKKGDSVKGWLETAAEQARLADDAFNPIQIKYSIEMGQWNNDHGLYLKSYEPNGGRIIKPYDTLFADYFAFYALEPQENWYGGRDDFPANSAAAN